jgi:hypothetical protein|tara:strand:- start:242 stop:418 length:177 start_codon:yes stop_codon:yes gene_type:complete
MSKKWTVYYRGNEANIGGGKVISKMEKRIFNSKEEAEKTATRKKILGVENVFVKLEVE